ncbi:MAG: ABC transporter permease, partial [Gemmatimonadota bacterium]
RTAWLRRREIDGRWADDRLGRREEGVMTKLWRDVRFAARGLRKSPGFTVVVLATLALGLGANTAIYSLVRAALFRPPAVAAPDELVAVYTTSRRGYPRSSTSYPDFLDYREQATLLADLAGTSALPASLGDDERGSRFIVLEAVTGNYFELLGVDAHAGRLLVTADDRLRAGEPVVVLSHDLWSTRFLGDPEVVGSTVRLNGRPFTVVGVARHGFTGLRLDSRPDAWVPMQAAGALGVGAIAREGIWEDRGSRWMGMSVGRMVEGATVEQVTAQLWRISEGLKETWGEARGPRDTTVDPLASYALPNGSEAQMTRFVWLLMGVVGFTLLLACANLANLVLVRATRRRREVAVRLALGAKRSHLVRQLLIESGLLAALGGVLGLGVAVLLLGGLGGFMLPGAVTMDSLGARLEGPVLVFAMVAAAATAILFGLAPTLQASRPDVVRSLRSGGRSGNAAGGDRLRKGLVTTQIGLCLVLLVGSGLFVQTLRRGMAAELGFEPERVAVARINLGLINYETSEAMAFLDDLRARLEARPEIQVASASTRVPLQDGGARGYFVEVPGYEPAPDEEMRVDLISASAGYFESLGLPILEGRGIDPNDGSGGAEVVVVNRSMAARYWPDGSPLGRTVMLGSEALLVVGVTEDVSWQTLSDEPTNFIYVPLSATASSSTGFITVAARTRGDPEAVLGAMRSEIVSLEPDAPITILMTMEDLVRRVLTAQEMGAILLSGFGLLALLLAMLGIAGVVSHTVSQQRRHIGIRMALGAGSGSVVREVARGLFLPVALGVVAGLLGAALLTRSVESFLFGVGALDPGTYVVVTALLLGITVLAALLPARKATRVQPVEVLKAE